MGRTLVEKILDRTQGRHVKPGEVVMCQPDLIYVIELGFFQVLRTFEQWGVRQLPNPDRIILVWDHEVPIRRGSKMVEMRAHILKGAQELGITVYDIGDHGISHQLVIEKGHILPGMLVVAQDTHAPTGGAVGAVSVPIPHEVSQVMATGLVWIKVPETIKISLEGDLGMGVTWRDTIHWVMKALGPERGNYRVLEFTGPALAGIDMGGRMTLCNISFNIGVKTAVVDVDDVTLEYLGGRALHGFKVVHSDPDAMYSNELHFDLSSLEPMVAPPPSPINPIPVTQATGIGIQEAFLGSCASGHIWDLRAAAALVKGMRVAPGVRFVVVPSTQTTYIQAAQEGLLETFVRAGAITLTPSCGPCYGGVAPLAPGEVCISTGTVNEPGRMGSREAQIFCASPLTVAASAIEGRITDPRKFLRA